MTQFVANSAVHAAHIWDISIFMQITEQEVENVGNEIQRKLPKEGIDLYQNWSVKKVFSTTN